MSVKERFSANLRCIRRRSGLTQEQLALLVEMDRAQISNFENAKRTPRLDTLLKLMGALDCRADELVEGMAWKPDLAAYGSWEVADYRP
jgi:transcriptional regulator with XRE-family HTH domain